MSLLPHFRPTFASLNRSPLWFRSSSLLLVLLGAAMLLLSLLPGIDLSRHSSIFIPTLLVGIVFGVFVFGPLVTANISEFARIKALTWTDWGKAEL